MYKYYIAGKQAQQKMNADMLMCGIAAIVLLICCF